MPPSAASSTDVVVAHPETGEVVALGESSGELLANVLLAVRERQQQLRAMERALEEELRGRLDERSRSSVSFGDYDVEAKREYRRVWDADELEATLRDLCEQGSLDPRDLTEIIRHETVVSGREALRVLGQVTGEAKLAIERCFSWAQKGEPRVTVTRPELTDRAKGT